MNIKEPNNTVDITTTLESEVLINKCVNGKKLPVVITLDAFNKMHTYITCEKQKNSNIIGIKIKILNKGCYGHKYGLEFYSKTFPFDENFKIFYHGKTVDLLFDALAMLRIIGMKIDYIETDLKSGFDFTNPNETGRCGCGESFS